MPSRSPGAAAAGKLATLLGATVCCNPHGEYLSLVSIHGEYAPCNADPGALHLLMPNAPEEGADPKQWLFLDTETTGLSGGTGTYPFLIGLAWWQGSELMVEQLFMREFSEDRSMLAAVAERLKEHPVLVTFNGKSFDWPLLETRFRMTRAIAPPPLRAHLDFLHPARNLWRLRLGSVRLSQLERHVLGWDRGEDMNSADIPRIYLDFVRGGNPEPLVPVFLHNQMDLRGLAGLAGRILSIFGDQEKPLEDGLELYGLSRICERRGQAERARTTSRSRSALHFPRRQIVLHAHPWRNWRSGTGILPALANYGRAYSATPARDTKPMSNWRSITNTKPATLNGPWPLPAKPSPSYVAPINWQ